MGYANGTKWTNEKIAKEIYKVMNALGIERMPSNQEIIDVMKSTKLTNAIRRNGGFYEWARRLNLTTKECETKFGKRYEKKLQKYLTKKGYIVERMSVKHPYDLLVNGCIKIDVKASRRYYYDGKKYYYAFNLEKKNSTCDIYVCFCVNNEEFSDKVLVIPSKFLKLTQLNIGAVSEYDKYINRWDYLDKFNEFYEKLS